MTAPLERVQRLRDQLAEATPAPWEAGERCIWAHEDNHPDDVVVSDGSTGNGGFARAADAALIVRLRNAAEPQLDLLVGVFERHQRNYVDALSDPGPWCTTCEACGPDGEAIRWPCTDYRAALAVLDKLDPEGADRG